MSDLTSERGPGSSGPRRRGAARGGGFLSPAILVQVLAGLGVAGVLAFFAHNVHTNIQRLGVGSGFGFLERPAGFEIAQRLIPYSAASTYWDAFVVAFLNTATVTLVAIVVSTLLGLFVGLMRLSSNPLLSGLAAAFVEVVRNIPLLLQLFFWYFLIIRPLPGPRQSLSLFDAVFLNNRGLFIPWAEVDGRAALIAAAILIAGAALLWSRRRDAMSEARARIAGAVRVAAFALLAGALAMLVLMPPQIVWSVPALEGFALRGGAEIIPEFVAVAIALSVYASAFVAEIFRGSFKGVPRGQREAGATLGLTPWQIDRRIVIPLALRSALPPLGGQYVILLKNSSLASAVGFPDLMLIFAGTTLNQTGQPMETMFMTLAAYVSLGLVIAFVVNALNRRLALVAR